MSERPVVDRVAELEAALAAKDARLAQLADALEATLIRERDKDVEIERLSALVYTPIGTTWKEAADARFGIMQDLRAAAKGYMERAEAAESALQKAQALESEVATLRSQLAEAKAYAEFEEARIVALCEIIGAEDLELAAGKVKRIFAQLAAEKKARADAEAALAVLAKPSRISAKTLYARLVAVILQEWGRRWPMSEYIDPESAVRALAMEAQVQDAARSEGKPESGEWRR